MGEEVVITGLESPAAAHLNGLTAKIFINNSSGQFRRDDGRYSVRVVGNAAYANKGFWAAPKNLTSGLTTSWATLRELRSGHRYSMPVSALHAVALASPIGATSVSCVSYTCPLGTPIRACRPQPTPTHSTTDAISVSDLEHPPILSTGALPTWVFEVGNGELPTRNFELGNCPLAFWSGQCRAIAHHDFSGLVLALR